MRKLGIALLLSCTSSLASAGIYKCVVNGDVTYQSKACPAAATKSDDVSYLESSESATRQQPVTPTRIYNDYRQDVKEIRKNQQTQRLIRESERERQRDAYDHQRARAKALENANAYNEQQRKEKARRDQKWQEDRDKRKARNNGTYQYWDIRTH